MLLVWCWFGTGLALVWVLVWVLVWCCFGSGSGAGLALIWLWLCTVWGLVWFWFLWTQIQPLLIPSHPTAGRKSSTWASSGENRNAKGWLFPPWHRWYNQCNLPCRFPRLLSASRGRISRGRANSEALFRARALPQSQEMAGENGPQPPLLFLA